MPTRAHGSTTQANDLLATKLEFPLIGSRIVLRNRLTETLSAGSKRKVTTIVAPAGYGKTTLLGEWLSTGAASGWRVAWLSLDVYDNAPLRFWSYVVAALHKVHPGFRFDIQGIFYTRRDFPDFVQINPLLDEISRVPDQVRLVLDNYEAITNPAINHGLTYLLDHLPANLRLVFSSRIAPLIPMARLRDEEQLVEVTVRDLAFTLEESETFFSDIMNVTIDSEKVVALWELTEGWVNGLQLVALCIQDKGDPFSLYDRSGGNFGQALEYVTEEILDKQDEDSRQFLLRTSVLQEMSAKLCDVVLERTDSHEMLSKLKQSNLFIVPVDEQQTYYRYNALFREALEAQLIRSQPEVVHDLHRRACVWLKQNGFPRKAVPHALYIGELEMAADCIDESAMPSIINLDVVNFVHWIDQIPEDMILRRPRLGIYYALVNQLMGRPELITPKLQIVEPALDRMKEEAGQHSQEQLIRWQMDAIRASVDCIGIEFTRGISRALKALESVPQEDNYLYGFVNHYMGYAYDSAGNLDAAVAALENACQFALQRRYYADYVYSRCESGRMRKKQGSLRRAESEYRDALDYAVQSGLDQEMVIFVQTGLAEISFERNEVEAAEQWMGNTVNKFASLKVSPLEWPFFLTLCSRLANYHLSRGDLESAAFYCLKVDKYLRDENSENCQQLIADIVDVQVRVWLAKRDLKTADAWLVQVFASRGKQGLSMAEKVGICRIYLARNMPAQALIILGEAEREARDAGRGERLIEVLALRALAMEALSETALAIECIGQAIKLAEPEGYVRLFVEHGVPMQRLLAAYAMTIPKRRQNAKKSSSRTYIRRLCAAIEAVAPEPDSKTSASVSRVTAVSPHGKPLTEREVQVFEMLANGKSAKDVASVLDISLNTVKSHLKNIYRKLNVRGKKEAVRLGIELAIVDRGRR